MYTGFYKLKGRPFQLSPDHRFYYDSSSHKKAMAYLVYGLNQGEGFIVITGDIGAGKTTLVGHLFSQLDSEKHLAANVVTTQLEADDVLRMVAAAFGIAQEGKDKATLLKKIEAFLVDCRNQGKRALLVVDEAQNLPARSLEELRMLSNFQFEEKPLLQCFLLGQPQFRHVIASPDLEQLRQRVIATYHLEPLDARETRAYIEHRLNTVGWQGDPSFTDEAFSLVYDYSGGVPRRVNTLCSRLLLFGFLEEKHVIDASVVTEVINDLLSEGGQGLGRRSGLPDLAEGPPTGAPPPSSSPAVPTVAADSAGLEEISRRVAVLEEYVRVHDRTIARALDIAARWLDGGEGAEAG